MKPELVYNWGGENRRVYRWNFNPIFVPYPETWHLTPETRHTGRNKYGIFFKAILWAILITPEYNRFVDHNTYLQRT